jgi:serine phosphatase RsbU (regulator of sigma subunit)
MTANEQPARLDVPGVSAGVDLTSGLTALDEAILSLHRPSLNYAQVVELLECSAVALGLAESATFQLALASKEGLAEGEHLIEVAGPDGMLLGMLRLRSVAPEVAGRLTALTRHAGIALASVLQLRAMERRERIARRLAERLQDALLPQLPQLPHTSVDVSYRAAAREAKVGGDFYDIFPLPDSRVLITVGDVVGKGIEAAVRTSRITQTLRALALQGVPLDQLLERADAQVVWQDPDIIATLWCGLYEPDSGELTFASLGHPPALLLRSTGEPTRLELSGLPLGLRDLLPAEPPEVRTRLLEAGDLLVLYTDGVVEAKGDYLEGQEALLQAVIEHRDEPLGVIVSDALDDLLRGANHSDDAVMLLLRRR